MYSHPVVHWKEHMEWTERAGRLRWRRTARLASADPVSVRTSRSGSPTRSLIAHSGSRGTALQMQRVAAPVRGLDLPDAPSRRGTSERPRTRTPRRPPYLGTSTSDACHVLGSGVDGTARARAAPAARGRPRGPLSPSSDGLP